MKNENGERLIPELAGLWVEFKPAVLRQVEVIERAARAASNHNLSSEDREAAKREAHKLAGSIGSFGCTEGSRLAAEIERMLAAANVEPQTAERLPNLVVRLRVQLETFH